MAKQGFSVILMMLLVSCAAVSPSAPADESTYDLRLIQYRDRQGNGLIPVARSAGEMRTRLWRQWLKTYQKSWQNQPHHTLSGKTQWCAQWQHSDDSVERVCRRENGLIWFGRGVLHDEMAMKMADKIWALK